MRAQHPILEAQVDHGGNNFDLLRLFAASAVIFSHSFGLVAAGGHADGDPLFRITGGQMTFGELGVYIFFVASGFLITPSLLRSRGLQSYFIKRLLRILPGLLFVVLVSMLVLGPLMTTLPLADYFRSTATWRYLVNATMFGSQGSLPGVFANTPLPEMVNGSLWTLKFEFFCYILLAVLGAAGLLRPGVTLVGALVCALGGKFYAGPGYGYIFYSSFFLAGASLYMWRRYVTLSPGQFTGALAALALSAAAGWLKMGFVVGGAYAVIYLAYRSDLGERFRRRFGDYSYGIYLFGFPVQQAVASMIGDGNAWWKEFLIAYPLVLLLAYVSWTLVEKPALTLRERLRNLTAKPEAILG